MVSGLEASVTNLKCLNIAVVLEERKKVLEFGAGNGAFIGPSRSNLFWWELLLKISKAAVFFLQNKCVCAC